MTFSLGDRIQSRQGEQYDLHRQYLNTSLARVQSIIGFDKVYARGEGAYPTGEYDCGCIYAAVPVLVGDTHYIYYGASNGPHNSFREGSLCLATLPRDRFAGYAADDGGGTLTTTPMAIGADGVSLNVDIGKGGSVRVGLAESGGRFVHGFALDDCEPIQHGGLDAVPHWRGGALPVGSSLAFVVELRNATIYAIRGA